jgi:plasmid stabilization system protein ParE
MEQHNVEFLPVALTDLEGIVFYYSQFSEDGEPHGYAMKIHNAVIKAAERLRTSPFIGKKVPDKRLAAQGYRMIVIEQKYSLFYRVFEEEAEVFIYRVLHGAMDYPRHLSETDIH